jgi:tetratricopeptide (TPR) repeat protein/DNA-binding XRE family transcriptional regulator
MKHQLRKRPFNLRLREERLSAGWSQRELADRLGTTTNNVSRWELGQTAPRPYFHTKLCALFGKSVEELGLHERVCLPSTDDEGEVAEAEQTDSSSISTEDITCLWTIPYARNPYFTGRDELLELLDQYLSPEGLEEQTAACHAALTQSHAIKGLGGIGKTQIAIEYAYRSLAQQRYTHTLWINATTEEAIISSFVELAELIPEFPAKGETDQRKLVAAVKRWLEQCQQSWLLIFDNADSVASIQPYLPLQGKGSILLTTRASAVGSFASAIEVEKMSFMEGTHLLLRRARQQDNASDEEINEAGNIVVALDHFPLALEQAGAYIEETGCGFSTYLQLYQEHRKELLARRSMQNCNYPDSVATTWSLSFQKLEQTNPAANELLCLCAFLAPDHIPEELFTKASVHLPPLLQQATVNLFTFNQIFEALLSFSLVKRLSEDNQLSIHRLVQAVLVDTMEASQQQLWAERAVRAVNMIFPQDVVDGVNWPLCLRYLEQAQVCYTLILHYQLLLPEAAELLDRTGIYLREHGSHSLAEPLYQQAIQIRGKLSGNAHTALANSLYNMAMLYRSQHKPVEAAAFFQQALQILELQSGPAHPDLMRPLTGLGLLNTQQEKYGEAEPLYLRSLQIGEQALGPEHPDLVEPLAGLACLYREQGKYAEAELHFLRAVRLKEQHFGPEHPGLAVMLNSLACHYAQQQKLAEAEPLFERTLLIRRKALRPEHPLLADPMNNLANIYMMQGKYVEAEPLLYEAIQIWEQQLGPDHPALAAPLTNLAELKIMTKQGSSKEVELLLQRARRVIEQHLGPEHSNVAHPLNLLATLYTQQGKYARAESLFTQALVIRERALEAHHPYIADTLHEFAVLREAQSNFTEALSLYQRALAIREQALGPSHATTVATRERLQALQATGEGTGH